MKDLPNARPGYGALHGLGLRVLPVLAGLGLACAAFAGDPPLVDSAAAPVSAPQAMIVGAPEGVDLAPTPGDPGESRHTAWHTQPIDEMDMQRWTDLQIKLAETEQGDGAGAAPRAGNLGRRDGDLDASLRYHDNEPGIVRRAIDVGNTPNDRAVGVAQRGDGRIYLVGQAGSSGATATNTRIAITRLKSSGWPDNSFGTNGIQVITLANPNLYLVKAVGLMEDGFERFYILAQDTQLANNFEFALICLRTPTVGGNQPFEACPNFGGATQLIRYYNFVGAPGCSSNHDIPYDIILDQSAPAARRLYLAGYAQRQYNECADRDFAVLRVDLNGVLDTTFNSTGRRMLGVEPVTGGGAWVARAYAVARRADGRIVLGGSVGSGTNARAIAVQFNSNGSIDSNFCAPGVATCESPATHRSGVRAWSSDTAASHVMALVPTLGIGLYVARTRPPIATATQGRLSRITGTGGCSLYCNETTMYPTSSTHLIPVSMVWHPGHGGTDGQIVVANYAYPNGAVNESQMMVYRFNADVSGSQLVPDGSFSTGATPQRQTITFPGSGTAVRNARPTVLVPDRQGRYLIAGYAAWSATDLDFGFARLQRDVIFINGLNH